MQSPIQFTIDRDAVGHTQLVVRLHVDPYQAGYVPAIPEAWSAFLAVDQEKDGKINPVELQKALSASFPGSNFSGPLARLLVLAFDTDDSGALQYEEFQYLHAKIKAWTAWYARAGESAMDKKPTLKDVHAALGALGVSLPPSLQELVVSTLDSDGAGPTASIDFPAFVGMMAQLEALHRLCDKLDPKKTGAITMSPMQLVQYFFMCRA